MTQTPTIAPGWTVPQDVLTFAAEQGVQQYLPGFLDVTRRVFPTARRYAVLVEDDPEIANDRHIVIEVDVALDIPQAQNAQSQWTEDTFKICPAPLICIFRLSVDLVE